MSRYDHPENHKVSKNEHLLTQIDELDAIVEDHIQHCPVGKEQGVSLSDWKHEIHFYRQNVFEYGGAWVINWNGFNPVAEYDVNCTWWKCNWRLKVWIKLLDVQGSVYRYQENPCGLNERDPQAADETDSEE